MDMPRYLLLLKYFRSVIAVIGFHAVNGFVLPKLKTNLHLVNENPSFIRASSSLTELNGLLNPTSTFLSNNAVEELQADAFTDEIVLFDDTIKIILFSFTAFVVLALVAKFFLNQMDSAIEKVLIEFESTLKTKYASRWVSIEAQLKGLNEPERSQKLFVIMEEMQKKEPEFYAKLMGDSGWSME